MEFVGIILFCTFLSGFLFLLIATVFDASDFWLILGIVCIFGSLFLGTIMSSEQTTKFKTQCEKSGGVIVSNHCLKKDVLVPVK